MNFKAMGKQRKAVLIAAAAGIISMFLPWVQISVFGYSQSVNGLHGSGILVLLCFVAAGLIAWLGNQTKTLDKTMWMITLVAGALAALIIIWDIISARESIYGSFLGFGIYTAFLAAIGVLLSAFIFRSPTNNIKDSFDSLKNDITNRLNTNSSVSNNAPPDNNDLSNSNSVLNRRGKAINDGYVKDPKIPDGQANSSPLL